MYKPIKLILRSSEFGEVNPYLIEGRVIFPLGGNGLLFGLPVVNGKLSASFEDRESAVEAMDSVNKFLLDQGIVLSNNL